MYESLKYAGTFATGVLLPVLAVLLSAAIVAGARQLRTIIHQNREQADTSEVWRQAFVRRIEAVEHEVKPNSGGSMRDAVTRIEGKVETVTGLLSQHLQDASANLDRIDRTIEKLRDTT